MIFRAIEKAIICDEKTLQDISHDDQYRESVKADIAAYKRILKRYFREADGPKPKYQSIYHILKANRLV